MAIQGIADGLRVHGRAVVELDARPQLDRDGLAAVGNCRQFGGQLGEDLQVLVDLVELLAHLGEDDAPDVGAGGAGVEDVRVLVERHHQRLLLGLGRQRPQHQGDGQGQQSCHRRQRALCEHRCRLHDSRVGRSVPEEQSAPIIHGWARRGIALPVDGLARPRVSLPVRACRSGDERRYATRANFWRLRISRGGVSRLPPAVHETSET